MGKMKNFKLPVVTQSISPLLELRAKGKNLQELVDDGSEVRRLLPAGPRPQAAGRGGLRPPRPPYSGAAP